MKLNEKIRRLRARNNLTQKELGEKIKVSETSIKCWESGTKNPSMEKIILLSKSLHVTTDYLLGVSIESSVMDNLLLTPSEKKLIEEYRLLDSFGQKAVEAICSIELSRIASNKEPVSIIPIKPSREIPLYITPIAAGFSVPLDEDEYEMIEIDESVPADADFAVRITGNSMYPYINDGDVVYAKRTNELEVGEVGIFCVNGAMYCKQYYIDDNRNLVLVSANPDLKNSNVEVHADSSCNVTCYGKVLLGRKIQLPKYFVRSL